MLNKSKSSLNVYSSLKHGIFAFSKKEIIIPFLGFFIAYLLYIFFLLNIIVKYTYQIKTPYVPLFDGISIIIGFLIVTLVSTFFGGIIIYFYSGRYKGILNMLKNLTKRFLTLYLVVLITGVLTIIGFILFFIPGAFLGVKFMFSQQEVLLNNKGVISSIRSSWIASKGWFWPQFRLFLIIFLISLSAYILSTFSTGNGELLLYLGKNFIVPLDIIISIFIAYSSVIGNVSVTDYFLRRKIHD